MKNKKRGIAILGSTGSIGVQALDVIKSHPEDFQVEVLTAQTNADLLIRQALEFNPNAVVIGDESAYERVKDILFPKGIKVFSGKSGLCQVVEMEGIDVVLTALVGYAGLAPTLAAIQAGKTIALANKETLVVAGEMVMKAAAAKKTPILPVDSEHSAIYQCLVGENFNEIESIYLTASGGPFRGKDREFLKTAKKEQALKHPNWDMGAKITIDSASLMNKGLEVIEAKWLFNLAPNQIKVIVHPQSIIHSIVQFEDGSMKAQMGLPDMKLPIQYALGFPFRLKNNFPRFNFMDYPNLTFHEPDTKTFRNLELAYSALEKGGNAPCILNAANEVVVDQFLKDKIGFLEMTDVIAACLDQASFVKTPTMEEYQESDTEVRKIALERCKKLNTQKHGFVNND